MFCECSLIENNRVKSFLTILISPVMRGGWVTDWRSRLPSSLFNAIFSVEFDEYEREMLPFPWQRWSIDDDPTDDISLAESFTWTTVSFAILRVEECRWLFCCQLRLATDGAIHVAVAAIRVAVVANSFAMYTTSSLRITNSSSLCTMETGGGRRSLVED